MRRAVILRSAVVVVAAVAALAPIPADVVESWYARGLYAWLQPSLTRASNLVPVALFDLAAIGLIGALAMLFARRVSARGWLSAGLRTAGTLVLAAAILYLLFLATWGLNYRRQPLERTLDYDPARVTRTAANAFAAATVSEVNEGHALAHRAAADPAALERAFGEAVQALGIGRRPTTGLPKRSVLWWYFRWAAIDGMTDPYFLEVIVNPDLLPFERPFVVAHEWAHLAGYASESEANFVAWLTCVRADALARYSGWLSAYQHAQAALSRDDRRALAALDPGPREDLRAMAERSGRSSPVVRRAARDAYDSYLKANRVAEGIASYDAVVRLMLGTRFEPRWQPALR